MRLLIAVIACVIYDICIAENKYGDHGIVLTGVPKAIEQYNNILTYSEDLENFDQNRIASYSTASPYIYYTTCAVDYDMNYLYLYDFGGRTIELVENFNTSMIPSEMVFSEQHQAIGSEHIKLEVDWVSHNLYWTDALNGWIAMQPSGPINDLSLYKVLIENLRLPRGLAMDPLAGYLFWCDAWEYTVERASLTGVRAPLPILSKLSYPMAVAVDHTEQKLYVADMDLIHSSDYDGHNKRIVRKKYTGLFYDLAIFENAVFAIDYSEAALNFYDKNNGAELHEKFGTISEEFWGICMYQSRNTPAVQDRCKTMGCADICVNEPDRATCLCREGFKLGNDGKSCAEDAGKFGRAVLFSTENQLCLLDIRILGGQHEDFTTPDCFYTGQAGEKITYMDLNMATREIYFAVDTNIYSLRIGSPFNQRRPITDQTMPITSLAFDYVRDVIYFAMKKQSDSAAESIWTIQLGTNEVKEHRTKTNGQVRGLVAVPHENRIYWIAGDSLIEYSDLAVTNVEEIQVLETDVFLGSATHMLHDPKSEILHVLDDGVILSIHYNGTADSYKLVTDDAADIVDFAIYKSYVMYIGHSNNNNKSTLTTANFYSSSSSIDSGELKDVGKVYNIKPVDVSLQPTFKSPCLNHNGGCEQLCYPKGSTAEVVCDCKLGFVLDTDGKQCTSNPIKDNMLLIADVSFNELYQVDLADPTKVIGIKTNSPGRPFGVMYDPSNDTIYWSSFDSSQIWTKSMDNAANQTLLVDMSVYWAYPRRMVQDQSSGYIYFLGQSWFESIDSFIGVIDRAGNIGKIIEEGEVLSCLAIHPEKGWIFWADTGRSESIHRANMDGTNSMKIVTDVLSPNGMAIDYIGNKLYWSDAIHNNIHSCEFDGSDVALFHTDSANVYVLDMKIMDGYLYYVAYIHPHVTKINLRDPTDKTDILMNAGVGKMHSLDIYYSGSTDKVPQTSVCKDGNHMCSHFCHPTADGYGCGCITNYELLSDGRTCSNAPRCPLYFGMALAQETDNCLRLPGNQCNFTCADGYRRKSNDLLSCTTEEYKETNDGLLLKWDQMEPCAQIFCPNTIQNGYLDKNCSREIGENCVDYMCKPGYEKNPDVTELVCKGDGTWNVTLPLCLEKCRKVTSEQDHAQFVGTCNRSPGDRCRVTCDERYRFALNVTALTCQSGSAWDVEPMKMCEEIKCPDFISSGVVNSSCSMLLDAVCSYTCDERFDPHPTVNEITCKKSGQWDKGGDGTVLCTAQPTSTESSNAVAIGVGVGIGVLVLIIIILVVLFFLFRRGKLGHGSSSSSPKAPPAVSFENPRYNESGAGNQAAEGTHEFHLSSLDDDKIDLTQDSSRRAMSDQSSVHVYDNLSSAVMT